MYWWMNAILMTTSIILDILVDQASSKVLVGAIEKIFIYLKFSGVTKFLIVEKCEVEIDRLIVPN